MQLINELKTTKIINELIICPEITSSLNDSLPLFFIIKYEDNNKTINTIKIKFKLIKKYQNNFQL
jgi:hypothetical protein